MFQGFNHPLSRELGTKVLNTATEGLRRRGFGEESFLEPIYHRLETRQNPADKANEMFNSGGVEELVERLRISPSTLTH